VEIVIKYLKNVRKFKEIGIWGRSMGAVTALLYSQKDSEIKALALDSPFSNMSKAALEISRQKSNLPSLLLKGVISIIKSQIYKRAAFDLEEIDVMKNLENCKMPSLFIVSKQDTLINPYHSDLIFKHYKGKKKLVYVNGDHNESREKRFISEIIQYLVSHLKQENEKNFFRSNQNQFQLNKISEQQ
jgi:fermentation-respiration switch protein FrsA (DUF1100 family)